MKHMHDAPYNVDAMTHIKVAKSAVEIVVGTGDETPFDLEGHSMKTFDMKASEKTIHLPAETVRPNAVRTGRTWHKMHHVSPCEATILTIACGSLDSERVLSGQNPADQEHIRRAAALMAPRCASKLPDLMKAFQGFRDGKYDSLILERLPSEVNHQHLSAIVASLAGSLINDGNQGCYITQVRDAGTSPGQRTGDQTSSYFAPHTDTAYAKHPVPAMLLHSISNQEEDGGISKFAALSQALLLLEEETIRVLEEPIYRVPTPSNFFGETASLFPILSRDSQGKRLLRFRRDGMLARTREGLQAALKLASAIEAVSVQRFLSPNSAVLINNHRVTHARTAFDSRGCAAHPRLLHRVYIDPRSGPS